MQRIYILINPAAGQEELILRPLHAILQDSGVEWEIGITRNAEDLRERARQAVKDSVDIVAVYGGDGTLMQVARSLMKSGIPMGILPGGTANVMAMELGIPKDLSEAFRLLVNGKGVERIVDMGEVNGNNFLLRVGIGLEADMVVGADPEMKAKVGTLAYAMAALKAIREPAPSSYELTLDGRKLRAEGLTCIIANAGNMGVPGLAMSPQINVSDGQLDVIVLQESDLGSILSVAAEVIRGEEVSALQQWQARDVEVHATPDQRVQVDGEPLGMTPVRVKIVPAALRIIVPPVTDE